MKMSKILALAITWILGASAFTDNAALADENDPTLARTEEVTYVDMEAETATTVQDLAPLTGRSPDEWEFVVNFYLWMTGIKGENTVGAITVPLDLDFSFIFDNLEGAFSSHFEARKGTWGAFFDFAYVSLGKQDIELPVTLPSGTTPTAEFGFNIWAMELMGNYRIGSERSAFDVLGGIRYNRQDLDVALLGLPRELAGGYDVNWTDPVFGGRYLTRVHDRVFLTLRGDVGGFGAGSELTVNVQGGVGIDLTRRLGLIFQYKFMDIEYEEGTRGQADFFRYDAQQQGALLGLSIYF